MKPKIRIELSEDELAAVLFAVGNHTGGDTFNRTSLELKPNT